MNRVSKPSSEHHFTRKRQLHERKKREQERSDFCFYGFMIFGVTGLFLWWGSHAFFGMLTQQFTPEEIQGAAKNVMNLWNVLMYFVPFIFFALSAGCAVVGLFCYGVTELLYRGEGLLIRRKSQKNLNSRSGKVDHEKGETDVGI